MLRIAVCDDEPEQLEKVTGMLRDYGQRRSVPPWQVFPFPSGYALLDGAEDQGGFDLYLLDVLMPGLDGIQTGAKLRAQGDPGEIVYLTNSRDHAVESYGVRAFYYLVKPVEAEALFPVLDAALERLERRDRESVVVHTAQGPRRLRLDRILYVERAGRGMRYHCADGTVDTRTIQVPFREAVKCLLQDPRFTLCGASFLLNLEHVAGVESQSALLDSGERVALPRAAVAPFKIAWGKYWLNLK